MYERFYGFRERPFSLLPDPDFLFLGEKHRTALDLLELAIFNQSGFCVISGEIGAGKTTLIRELLNRLDDSVRVGLVSNTHPSFGELLQWIMAAYGLKCGSDDHLELHKRFIDFAIQQYAENKHTLLVIDEAQNLSVSAMEELRMLSNVNSDKDLVLQVILIGQQQLRDKLKKPELEQFAQRIALDYHLKGLDREETCQYIRHRVKHAGGSPDLFEPAACQAVFAVARGIPRVINRVCDLSLVYGYSEERPVITAELVNKVIEDQHMGNLLESLPLPGSIQEDSHADLRAAHAASDEEPRQEKEDIGTAEQVTAEEEGPADDTARQRDTADKPEEKRSGKISQSARGDDTLTVEEGDSTVEQEVRGSFIASESAKNKTDSVDSVGVPAAAQHAEILTAGAQHPEDSSTHSALDSTDSEAVPDTRPGQAFEQLPRAAEAEEAVPASQLHELVVEAEQKKNRKGGDRGALLLLTVVVAMVSVAGWMTRDIWSPALLGDVASVSQRETPRFVPEKAATSMAESGTKSGRIQATTPSDRTDSERPAMVPVQKFEQAPIEPEPKVHTNVAGTEPEPDAAVQVKNVDKPEKTPAVAGAAQPSGETTRKPHNGEHVAGPAMKPAPDPAVQDAALRQEAERLARLKSESERLERERLATEKRLARQRAARLELERMTRLEQEKLKSESERLERERLATEERLARQRKARQELERRTRLEREKIKQARETIEQVAVDRVQAERQLSVERDIRPVPAAVTNSGAVTSGDQAVASGLEDKATEQQQDNSVSKKSPAFSSNPCDGPTARFMSTCR